MKNDYSAILNNGKNIDMTVICGCIDAKTLNDCEANCSKYSSCDNVAIANDILRDYEEEN